MEDRRVIGPYRLEAELGRGGMGTVWRAVEVASGRPVALKLLEGGLEPARLARFQREGELTARLRHPAIVTVHQAFVHEGRPALVYELVEGRSLGEAWTGLDRAARVDLVRQVAEGIAHAHAQGVVHRDLKPENVVVGADGRARVIDFGLATACDLERLTLSGALLGTPRAMAPEQAKAERGEIGPWTDVWALGCLLYEALVGRRPIVAESFVQYLARVTEGRFEPPRAVDPTVPPELERMCLRCLTVDPAGRYPDARELVTDLRSGRQATGRPLQAGALAAVAALLLVVAGVALALRARPPTPPTPPPAAGASPVRAAQEDRPPPAAEGAPAEVMLRAGRELLALRPDDPPTVAAGLAWLAAAGPEGWWRGGYHLSAPAPGRPARDGLDAAAARDAETGLAWVARAARAGHPAAMRRMAEVYAEGWLLEQSLAEAASWYRRAAEAGDGRAMFWLSKLLQVGAPDVARDPVGAKAWMERAAAALPAQASLDPEAACTFGMLLLERDPTEAAAGAPEAVPWLRRALAGGAHDAGLTLGLALVYRPDLVERPGEALELLLPRASWEKGTGAFLLGRAYQRGQGVPVDRAAAIAWYRRAIEAGSEPAPVAMGDLLLRHDDPALQAEGLDRLREVAPLHAQVALLLAEHLSSGERIRRVPLEALEWTVRATAAPWRTEETGERALELGKEILLDQPEQEDAAGRQLLEHLSAQGHPLAEHLLGVLALLARPQRPDEAIARYRAALARGHEPSRWPLVVALRACDAYAEAEADLRALAARGDARAMRELGLDLARGDHLPRDDERAVFWLQRALEAGEERTALALAQLAARGRGRPRDPRAALDLLERGIGDAAIDEDLRVAGELGVELARELGDEVVLVRWLRVGAEADEPGCLEELARRLEVGEGVAKDPEEAARLRERLAAVRAPGEE